MCSKFLKTLFHGVWKSISYPNAILKHKPIEESAWRAVRALGNRHDAFLIPICSACAGPPYVICTVTSKVLEWTK